MNVSCWLRKGAENTEKDWLIQRATQKAFLPNLYFVAFHEDGRLCLSAKVSVIVFGHKLKHTHDPPKEICSDGKSSDLFSTNSQDRLWSLKRHEDNQSKRMPNGCMMSPFKAEVPK